MIIKMYNTMDNKFLLHKSQSVLEYRRNKHHIQK